MSTEVGPSDSVKQAAVGLNKFQLRALQVIEYGTQTVSSVQGELDKYYPQQVTRGRLYSNLDTLVNVGVVEKDHGNRSGRTNAYSITELGYNVLQFERQWCDELEVMTNE